MRGVNSTKGGRLVRPKTTAVSKFIRYFEYSFQIMHQSLIQKPIGELDLTESFKEMAYRHDFKTLEDIVNWPVNVLLMHDGFTHHHYQELRELLKSTNNLHLLKTTGS